MTNKISIKKQDEILAKFPKENATIFKAYLSQKKLSELNKKDNNDLLHALAQLVYLCGLSDDVNDDDLLALSSFVKKSFPNYNILDILQIGQFYCENKLGDIEHYSKFSIVFFGKLFAKYRVIRSRIIVELKQELKKQEIANNPVQIDLEKQKMYRKKMFLIAWEEVNVESVKYYDSGDIIFTEIFENQLLDFNEKLRQEAKKYAELELRQTSKHNTMKQVIEGVQFRNFSPKEKKAIFIKKKKEFYVNHWLKKISKKDLISYLDKSENS